MATAWKSKKFQALWPVAWADGFELVTSVDFVIVKKRWAKQALARQVSPNWWTSTDIEGTNLVLLVKCPYDPKDCRFTPEYVAKARAYQRELDQILDVPIEEPHGTTTVEKKESPKRRKGA